MLKNSPKFWAITLLLLSCSSLLSIMAVNGVAKASGWQTHAFRVINKAESLLSNFKDAEIGQRDYLLTNDERFLEPYFTATSLIEADLIELQQHIKDVPQQQQLDKLKPLVAARMAMLNKTLSIQQYNTAGDALEMVKKGQDKAVMDAIRLVLQGFTQNEQNELAQQSTTLAVNIRYLVLSIIANTFLVIFVAAGVSYQLRLPGEESCRKAASQTTLLDSANAAIISTTPDGIITSLNRGLEQLLGYRAEDLVGKQSLLIFHDADEVAERADRLNSDIRTRFETLVTLLSLDKNELREWTYLHKDGTRIPMQLSISSMHDETGKLIGFLLLAMDITRCKKAETNLENSQKFARSVFDALFKQFCVLDQGGHILAINKPYLDFECEHDGSAEMLEIGRNYPNQLAAGLVINRGGDAFAKGIRSVLNGTESCFSLEYSYLNQTEQHWFSGKVIPFPAQELGSVIVIHENISEHKRMEHRFRQAVESGPCAIAMVNAAGLIVMVNAKTEAYFGYSRTELLGQSLEILVPERFRIGHVGSRQAFFADSQARQMFAGLDLYGLRKDGTEFPAEIGLSSIDSHEEKLVLSTILDITERKRIQKKLQDNKERLNFALDTLNTGTWELDLNSLVAHHSLLHDQLFGYATLQPEWTFQTFLDHVIPEDKAAVIESFTAANNSQTDWDFVCRICRVDGEIRWLWAKGRRKFDNSGCQLSLAGIVQDITERKLANDKLQAALSEKELLLKEVYHRVKNNLQVVSSLINLQADNVKNEEAVDQLKQSADRIKSMALIHEKLYQSKSLAKINFNIYIHSLVEHLLFSHAAHSDKIKINMTIDDLFLDFDTAIPCGLIINELLSNALKHAFPDDQHGEIDISFRLDQGEFILVISDNGIGIPADLDSQKITSLGLQLVATLTNQLSGQMTLEKSNGTMFTLRFINT